MGATLPIIRCTDFPKNRTIPQQRIARKAMTTVGSEPVGSSDRVRITAAAYNRYNKRDGRRAVGRVGGSIKMASEMARVWHRPGRRALQSPRRRRLAPSHARRFARQSRRHHTARRRRRRRRRVRRRRAPRGTARRRIAPRRWARAE